jgi:universal stress protein A
MDYALSFSQVFGSQIYILHTLDTIPVLALDTMDLTTETVIYETEKHARNDLHLFVISRVGNIPNLVEVVRRGIAEDQIVKVAKEEGIDLIVMATHGRSGIAHVLLGSVAEKVVQHSPVPVLTVKPGSVSSSKTSTDDVREDLEPAKR